MTVGWPIVCLLLAYPTYPWGVTMASVLPALSALLLNINIPREHVIAETVWWAASWNVFFILLTIVVTALAMWTLDRRSRSDSARGNEVERRTKAQLVCHTGDGH